MKNNTIRVEVAYALPEKQVLKALDVPEGTSVIEAIELSKIMLEFPGKDLDSGRLGIFSMKAKPADILREGDRVEIYRPLIADPKEARRKRALDEKPGKA